VGAVSGEEGGEGDAQRGGGEGAGRKTKLEMRRRWRRGSGSERGTAVEGDGGRLAMGPAGMSTEKE